MLGVVSTTVNAILVVYIGGFSADVAGNGGVRHVGMNVWVRHTVVVVVY